MWKLLNKEIDDSWPKSKQRDERKQYECYVNTGIKSPSGFFYCQGIDLVGYENDNNKYFDKKRELVKWELKPKKK